MDAEDFERLFAYDADGRLDTATDQRGFETDYDYGFAGQLLGSDLPDGASISQSIFRDLGLADLSIGQGTPSNPAPLRPPRRPGDHRHRRQRQPHPHQAG